LTALPNDSSIPAMSTPSNPLARYLSAHDVAQDELGKQVGVARGVVARWLQAGTPEGRIPRTRDALKLQEVTGGAVPASYWAGLEDQRRARRRRGRRSSNSHRL
jgi:hypothetical protein